MTGFIFGAMWKIPAGILFLFVASVGNAQESLARYHEQELKLVIDNDVFTSLIRDQYYTSGLFGYYRKVLPGTGKRKRITSYGLSQRVYTPQFLSWTEISEFDRPYAGMLSLHWDNEFYWQKEDYLKVGLELGIMGPASFTGDIHQAWHKVLGLVPPRGWNYQIGNNPIVNVYGTYGKSLIDHQNIDIIPESNAAFGTLFSNVRQEVTLRLGNLRPIDRSIHFGGVLGAEKVEKAQGLQEYYLFYSPGLEYNFHNATIEGSLFRSSEFHVEEPVNIVFQNALGIMMSWPLLDLRVYHFIRTRETLEATNHTYVGVHLSYRLGR